MHVRFIFVLLILLLFLPTVVASKNASRGDGNFNVSFSLIDTASDYDALLGVDGNKVVDKRVYDRAILTEGHLPIAFKFAGTQGAEFVVLSANKISKLFSSDKGSFFGDISNYHNSKIWFLNNESYSYVEYFYNGSIFYNQTFANGSTLIYNQTLYSSRVINSWKYVWREVSDFNTLTLNKNQIYIVDINPKFRATTEAFAVDIIPSFSLLNNNYTLSEFDWFNSTWRNATQLITVNDNATKVGYILANVNITWRNGMSANMSELRITDSTNSSEYNFWRKDCVAWSFCIVDINYTTMWSGTNISWVWYKNNSIVTDKSNFSLAYDKANNLALNFDTTLDGFDLTAVSNSSFSRYNTTSLKVNASDEANQEINPVATNLVYGNATFIYEFSAYVTRTGGQNFYNYLYRNQSVGLGVKAGTTYWTYFIDGGLDSANLNIPVVVGWNDITLYNHNNSYVNFTLSAPNRTVYSQIIAWCATGCRGVSIAPEIYRYSYITAGESYFDGDRLRYLLNPEPTYSFGSDVVYDNTAPTVQYVVPANTSIGSTQINLTANITEANLDALIFTNSTGSNITLYDDSLVLYMPMNNISDIGENATHVVDISSFGNNGTFVGAIWNTSGKFGTGISFNGTAYVNIGNASSLNLQENAYISFWINGSPTTSDAYIIDKGWKTGELSTDRPYAVIYAGGGLPRRIVADVVNSSAAKTQIVSITQLEVNIWNFIEVTKNSTSIELMINREYEASSLFWGDIGINTQNLWVGGKNNNGVFGSGSGFNGTIDELRIENVIPSNNERDIIYTNRMRIHKQSLQNYTVEGNFTESAGQKNYTIYANDTSANSVSSKVFFTVDTLIPTLTVVSPINATYANTSLALNVYADETISAWLYSINGTANTTFSPNTTITVVSGNNQNLTVYANDSAGNWGTPQLLYFSVDLTAPTLTINSPESNYNSSSSAVNFNWTSTMGNVTTGVIFSNISIDGVVNVSNSQTNNGTATNYSISNIAEGAHNWSIKTWVSNSSTNTSSTYVFTVDTTVPVVENLSISPSSVPEQGSVGLSVDVLETATNISYVIIRDESLAKNHTLSLDSGNTYKVTISGTSTTGIANHTLRVYANNTASLTNNSVTGTLKVTAQAGSGGGGGSSGSGGGSTTIIIEKAKDVAEKFGVNLTFGANIVFFTDDWFIREYCQLLYGVPDSCTENKFEAGTVISGSGLVYSTIATVQEESYKWQLSRLDPNNNRYVKLQDFQSPYITFVPSEAGNYSIYFEAKDTADNIFNTTHDFAVLKDFVEPSLIEKIEGSKKTEAPAKVPRTLAESLKFKIGDFGGWLKGTFSGEDLMYKFSMADYGRYTERSEVQFGAMIVFAMGLFFVISRVDL